ncbi:MAG: hypothetical protein ACRDJV_07955 [Actinomycetota bacterium]
MPREREAAGPAPELASVVGCARKVIEGCVAVELIDLHLADCLGELGVHRCLLVGLAERVFSQRIEQVVH